MHAPSLWAIGVHTAGSKTRATRTERWHAIEVQTRMEYAQFSIQRPSSSSSVPVLHPASQFFIRPYSAVIATV